MVVQGKEYKFINGVSLGLDGYCCEKGDRIRAAHRGSRPVRIHYTLIALKGILFAYRPADCTVTVDGEEFTYRRVWLAPTMNGRYYGGGMMIAPTQDRLNAGRHVTFVAAHDLSRALILTLFPSIFGGKHLRYTKRVSVHTGHRVTVRFARPCAFQIDGEPISDVTEYTVLAGPAKADARPEPADL